MGVLSEPGIDFGREEKSHLVWPSGFGRFALKRPGFLSLAIAVVVAAAGAIFVTGGTSFAAEILPIAGNVVAFAHFTFAIRAGTSGRFSIHNANT